MLREDRLLLLNKLPEFLNFRLYVESVKVVNALLQLLDLVTQILDPLLIVILHLLLLVLGLLNFVLLGLQLLI